MHVVLWNRPPPRGLGAAVQGVWRAGKGVGGEMKVIAKGRPQKGWAVEVACTGKGNGNGGCGARLLVDESDVFETQQNCRDETDYFTTFRCVECGVLTDLDGVPAHVRETARKQRGKWKP